LVLQQLEVIVRRLIGDTLPGHLAPILGAVGSAQDSSSDLAQQNAKDLRLMTLDMRTKDRLEAVRLSKEGNAKVSDFQSNRGRFLQSPWAKEHCGLQP
jgi:hypothetical protein